MKGQKRPIYIKVENGTARHGGSVTLRLVGSVMENIASISHLSAKEVTFASLKQVEMKRKERRKRKERTMTPTINALYA